jgi:hypothetical protein
LFLRCATRSFTICSCSSKADGGVVVGSARPVLLVEIERAVQSARGPRQQTVDLRGLHTRGRRLMFVYHSVPAIRTAPSAGLVRPQ